MAVIEYSNVSIQYMNLVPKHVISQHLTFENTVALAHVKNGTQTAEPTYL